MQIMLTQKKFEIKALGQSRDLYVQSDTLLLADVFETFWNMLFKKHEFDLARLYSAPWLARQAGLKKTKV